MFGLSPSFASHLAGRGLWFALRRTSISYAHDQVSGRSRTAILPDGSAAQPKPRENSTTNEVNKTTARLYTGHQTESPSNTFLFLTLLSHVRERFAASNHTFANANRRNVRRKARQARPCKFIAAV